MGEVINERQLHRHRNAAGYRIGAGRHVDLFRYVAWLVGQRHASKPESQAHDYDAHREQARARNAAISQSGRDIGEFGFVVNPPRRRRAAADFRFFCEAYFPLTFHLAWSQDHLKVISKIDQAVLRGGLFAMAMPRGSGKTTICECACIWAVLNGHREFVCLIGSDEGHAMDMLESIKTEIDGNDLLGEDYPEVVHPIQKLDGIANRCAGQLYRGERTHIGWTAKDIVLPTLRPHGWFERADHRDFVGPDGFSLGSGAIIKVAGITGRIRGMKFKRADGQTVRPTLVVLDDPQTDESARSLSQCATRESILAGAVLGLAGPGKKISGIMPCTVIRPGDMADRILDRDQHPQWQGERTKMVYAFPTNEKLWQQYAEILAESFRAGNAGDEATEFYRANRAEMDIGAVIAWPERFNPDELSAIQHAMNLKLQDEAAFFAEYQNEPLPEEKTDDELTADQIAAKINRLKRSVVPLGCEQVTMFIDIQATLLFYVVTAWHDDFTGCVIDYGSYPDQKRGYFTLRDARNTLSAITQNAGLEGSIFAGLEALTDHCLGREWPREDGVAMKIDRCLIDANWGSSTDIVYQFCRQTKHAGVVLPAHGRFVGASTLPFSEHRRKPGERVGLNWRVTSAHGKRAIRHVLFDTNYWKSFVHARLAVPTGDKGCLSLFGDRTEQHRLLAEHLTAEYRVRTEGRGRVVDEWKQRPEKFDNHWLDCLVGCAVAASMQGAVLFGTDGKVEKARPRVSFSALQKGRRV
ncbi:MAG: terminase gpA endonuclease subunit [Gemmataceae bacterium]